MQQGLLRGGRSCPPGFSWIGQRSVRLSVGNHRNLREIRKNNLEHPPCCHRGNLVRKVFQEKTLRLGRCFRDMLRSSHWRYRPSIGQVSLSSIYFLYDNVIHVTKGLSTMAANQLVQARIDGAIKEEAAAVLAAMGLTVSDAVRLLLTRVAQEKALPFAPLIPNTTTIKAMKEARKGGLPQFDSVQALMDDLHAQD